MTPTTGPARVVRAGVEAVMAAGDGGGGAGQGEGGRGRRPVLEVLPGGRGTGPKQDGARAPGRAYDGPQGFLVDDPWPEYVDLVASHVLPGDMVAIPVGGTGPLRGPEWNIPAGARVFASSLLGTLRRQELAELSVPGARVRAALKYDELIARSYVAALTRGISHVVVSQNLLPFMWRTGALRYRTFDVLMVRLPMLEQNLRVVEARSLHQGYADHHLHVMDATLAAHENQALLAARRILTPHAEIAAMFPDRAVQLPWMLPPARPRGAGTRVAFPAPTAALDGAYELRTAARQLGVPVVVTGGSRVHHPFWRGVEVDVREQGTGFFDGTAVAVHAAFSCAQPRGLLAALAAGLPVVATRACGLPASMVERLVPRGDVRALRESLAAVAGRAA